MIYYLIRREFNRAKDNFKCIGKWYPPLTTFLLSGFLYLNVEIRVCLMYSLPQLLKTHNRFLTSLGFQKGEE